MASNTRKEDGAVSENVSGDEDYSHDEQILKPFQDRPARFQFIASEWDSVEPFGEDVGKMKCSGPKKRQISNTDVVHTAIDAESVPCGSHIYRTVRSQPMYEHQETTIQRRTTLAEAFPYGLYPDGTPKSLQMSEVQETNTKRTPPTASKAFPYGAYEDGTQKSPPMSETLQRTTASKPPIEEEGNISESLKSPSTCEIRATTGT